MGSIKSKLYKFAGVNFYRMTLSRESNYLWFNIYKNALALRYKSNIVN